MPSRTLVYDVGDKPKFKNLILYSLQLLLAIIAATIAVPTIIGLKAQISAAILGAGLGTLVYILFTKGKSPIVVSSSFTFVAAFPTALAFGYMGVVLGGIFSGLVYVVIAIIVKLVGTRWLNKLLPPVVIGPVVALIGLGLAGSAIGNLIKSSDPSNPGGGYNLVAILIGLITFFIVVIVSVQNKRKGLKLIPFIIGILAGYAIATIFTVIGNATNVEYIRIVDWSPIIKNYQNFSWESIISVPKISIVEAIKELINGDVSAAIKELCPNATLITGAGVASIAIAFCPIALVSFAEHIADHKNMSRIIDRDLLTNPGLTRTLLGDGIGSIVGTVGGVCPNTSYGEGIACVAMTGNASVRTTFMTAIMCVILSFLAPICTALQTIPSCVMGGVCLALYGYIAVSGLRMFKDIDLDNNANLFTVCVILIIGIGGLVIKIPYEITASGEIAKAVEITSIATAMIIGILTYQLCRKITKASKSKVHEVYTGVRHEDLLRVYLKEFSIETLSHALLIFGFIHENVDFTVAQLSNFMHSDAMLNILSREELIELIKMFKFKGNITKANKAACIKIIRDNCVRIDRSTVKSSLNIVS